MTARAATPLIALSIGAGLLTAASCHRAATEAPDAGEISEAPVVLPGLSQESARIFTLPPGALEWTIVRNAGQLALEWGQQDPEYSLMRVDLPTDSRSKPVMRYHHPTTWASSTHWVHVRLGNAPASVAVFEGISLERFGDDYAALLPDGGFAWYGRCASPDSPELSTGGEDGEAWMGSGTDCFRVCPGIHQMSMWRISESGDGGFTHFCPFPDVPGPKDLVLHPDHPLGAALIYPVYPGPRVIRLFEFDRGGVTRVSPDIPMASAAAFFWPLGRRLLFAVTDPTDPSAVPKPVRQIDWVGDEVIAKDRPDLSGLFQDLQQFAGLDSRRVVVVGDAQGSMPTSPDRLLALVDNDVVTGTTHLPRGVGSKYVFWSLGGRIFAFWDVATEEGDGGRRIEVWGKELEFDSTEAKDAGLDAGH